MAFFALLACFSLYKVVSTLVIGKQEQSAFDELTAAVEQKKDEREIRPEKPETPAAEPSEEISTEPVILPEYADIFAQNSDFYGWLRIDGTPINYPVMYTPEEPQYYLHRAFDKSGARSGTPFLDGACYEGCGNYILYGHNMKNDTMFGTLPKYAKKSFWEQHPTVCFDTLYEYREYAVIAAFYAKPVAKTADGFRYYKYTDLTDPSVFADYMAQVGAAALYDTGITANYGDELITLSTCSYHTEDGRFVVVAKRISE